MITFKEYLNIKENSLKEGKVGRFLGSMAGMTVPALTGSYLSSLLFNSPMLDTGGAPGGLAGATLTKYGYDAGGAIGSAIGDTIGKGIQKVGSFFKKSPPKPTGPTYFDRLAGNKPLDHKEIEVVNRKSGIHGDKDTDNVNSYMTGREDRGTASKILISALERAGYTPEQVASYDCFNVSPGNNIVTVFENLVPKMKEAIKKNGHAAGLSIVFDGIQKLKRLGLIGEPDKKKEAEFVPEKEEMPKRLGHNPLLSLNPKELEDKRSAEDQRLRDIFSANKEEEKPKDLFGSDLLPIQKKRKPSYPRKRKVKDLSPGLFD